MQPGSALDKIRRDLALVYYFRTPHYVNMFSQSSHGIVFRKYRKVIDTMACAPIFEWCCAASPENPSHLIEKLLDTVFVDALNLALPEELLKIVSTVRLTTTVTEEVI
jgi:hypothetical protein